MSYLTDLQGRRLMDSQSQPLGRVRDLVASIAGAEPAHVVGLLVQSRKQVSFLPLDQDAPLSVSSSGLMVPSGHRALVPFSRRKDEVLLARDVLDGTVIDLRGPRIVRVNEVLLDRDGPLWRVTAVDVGLPALLRRILPQALSLRVSHQHELPWADLELLSGEVPGGVLPPDHHRLGHLHPADIARVAEALPPRLAAEIVISLDDDVAADIMEEMIDARQAQVVELIDVQRVAKILAHMAPDAAADVLALIEPGVVNEVLAGMDLPQAADLHALLTYPHDTAGGLMNPQYVLAPGTLRVADAAQYLRPRMARLGFFYYVYIVNDLRDRRLTGAVTLRDILLAQPAQCLAEIASPVVRTVGPEESAPKVAQVMSEYNLMALPVVDGERRLLGIITIDDALEVILPETLRRRIPRMVGYRGIKRSGRRDRARALHNEFDSLSISRPPAGQEAME